MSIILIDAVGSTMQQKSASGDNFDGSTPANTVPVFEGGIWKYPQEMGTGGGLFVFDVFEPVFITGLEFTAPGGGLTDWRFEVQTEGEDPITWVDGTNEQHFVLTESTRLLLASSQTLAFITNGSPAGEITVRVKAALVRPYNN